MNGYWVGHTLQTKVRLKGSCEENVSGLCWTQHNSCSCDNVNIGPQDPEVPQMVVKSALTTRKAADFTLRLAGVKGCGRNLL